MKSVSVLAKPIANPNPRNGQLYKYVNESERARVEEFTILRLLVERVDIVHIHWPDRVFYWRSPKFISLFVLFGLLFLSRLKKAKIIYTCHNLAPKVMVGKFWLDIYYKLLSSYVDGVISPRKDLLVKINDIFPSSVVSHIPLGLLDTPDSTGGDILRHVFSNSEIEPFLLIPGLQESTKKTEITVRNLLKKICDKKILVVGKFADKEYYDSLVREFSYSKQVVIIDRYLSDEDLCALVKSSFCVVASQVNGTNSGIALLALALNKPCFCATSEIASSVRSEYKNRLVWSVEDIDSGAVWEEIFHSKYDSSKYNMKSIADMTVDFYFRVSMS